MNRKTAILACCFALAISCVSREPKTSPFTPIGEGVEIYRAHLVWEKNNLGRNVKVKSATILNSNPLVKYDEIVSYYRFKPTPLAGHHLLLDLTKVVHDMKGGSPIFGPETFSHALASDTGFCVTVDKQVIFAGIWGHISTLYYSDLIFRASEGGVKPNSVVIAWDSVYSIQGQPTSQTVPDPRFDSRIIGRLQRDGKLKL